MSYVTKNANLLLFFLIVIVCTLMVGATAYSYNRFTNLNKVYDTKVMELQNITTQLEKYQATLEKARNELQLKSVREEQFTSKFEEIRDVKEDLEAERKKIISDNGRLNESVRELNSQVSLKSSEISTLKTQVSDLQDEVKAQKQRVSNLKEEVDCLETTPDSSEGNC